MDDKNDETNTEASDGINEPIGAHGEKPRVMPDPIIKKQVEIPTPEDMARFIQTLSFDNDDINSVSLGLTDQSPLQSAHQSIEKRNVSEMRFNMDTARTLQDIKELHKRMDDADYQRQEEIRNGHSEIMEAIKINQSKTDGKIQVLQSSQYYLAHAVADMQETIGLLAETIRKMVINQTPSTTNVRKESE